MALPERKCKFLQTEVEYLGHIVNQYGIKADKSTVEANTDRRQRGEKISWNGKPSGEVCATSSNQVIEGSPGKRYIDMGTTSK